MSKPIICKIILQIIVKYLYELFIGIRSIILYINNIQLWHNYGNNKEYTL